MRPVGHMALLAWSIPVGVLAQFTLAGLSLFRDVSLWAAHGVLGFALMLPIAAVALLAFLRPGRARLRVWAALMGLTYVAQVTLGAMVEQSGSGLVPALHVANAGLVLLSSFALAWICSTPPARSA